MRLFFKILGVLVLLMVVAVFIASQFINKDAIMSQVSDRVKQVSGRTLSVEGPLDLQIFPTLSLALNDAKLSNVAGSKYPTMADIELVEIHIPWQALLSKELEVEKFVVKKPHIILEKNRQGEVNWQLVNPNNSADNDVQSTVTKPNVTQSATLPDGFDLRLGQVQIIDGTISYFDQVKNQQTKLEQVQLEVQLESLRQPLKVTGQLDYMAETFDLDLRLSTLAKLLQKQQISTEIKLESQLVSGHYNGLFSPLSGELEGHLEATSDSLKNLLQWLKKPITAKAEAFNQAKFSAQIKGDSEAVSFTDLNVLMDKLAIQGEMTLHLSNIPKLVANFDLGELNINPYLPSVEEKPESASETTPPKEKSKQPIQWSDKPIDLTGLSALQANIKLDSTSFQYRDITLGENSIEVNLKQSILTLLLTRFNAYQGKGEGKVVINAASNPYRFDSQFTLRGIDAQPLLTDSIGFERLMGRGDLSWSLTSRGNSQKAIIEQLNGRSEVSLSDGAVKGFNLAAVAKSAKSLLAGDLSKVNLDADFSDSEATDFAAFSGSFSLVNGVATTQDMNLLNPFIRVKGEGDINLPATKLDLLVTAELVDSSKGQNAQTNRKGLIIPMKVSGSFHNIKVKPNVVDEGKEKIKEKLKDKLKKLFG
ncbi:AsmA family protein [Thalassotalea aquiviva]|uniref:AsmA family protein n=1 Tax=Thalassotalea aquiviva TaxID=3242415 RepID=UPI00352B0A6F